MSRWMLRDENVRNHCFYQKYSSAARWKSAAGGAKAKNLHFKFNGVRAGRGAGVLAVAQTKRR